MLTIPKVVDTVLTNYMPNVTNTLSDIRSFTTKLYRDQLLTLKKLESSAEEVRKRLIRMLAVHIRDRLIGKCQLSIGYRSMLRGFRFYERYAGGDITTANGHAYVDPMIYWFF